MSSLHSILTSVWTVSSTRCVMQEQLCMAIFVAVGMKRGKYAVSSPILFGGGICVAQRVPVVHSQLGWIDSKASASAAAENNTHQSVLPRLPNGARIVTALIGRQL